MNSAIVSNINSVNSCVQCEAKSKDASQLCVELTRVDDSFSERQTLQSVDTAQCVCV